MTVRITLILKNYTNTNQKGIKIKIKTLKVISYLILQNGVYVFIFLILFILSVCYLDVGSLYSSSVIHIFFTSHPNFFFFMSCYFIKFFYFPLLTRLLISNHSYVHIKQYPQQKDFTKRSPDYSEETKY